MFALRANTPRCFSSVAPKIYGSFPTSVGRRQIPIYIVTSTIQEDIRNYSIRPFSFHLDIIKTSMKKHMHNCGYFTVCKWSQPVTWICMISQQLHTMKRCFAKIDKASIHLWRNIVFGTRSKKFLPANICWLKHFVVRLCTLILNTCFQDQNIRKSNTFETRLFANKTCALRVEHPLLHLQKRGERVHWLGLTFIASRCLSAASYETWWWCSDWTQRLSNLIVEQSFN